MNHLKFINAIFCYGLLFYLLVHGLSYNSCKFLIKIISPLFNYKYSVLNPNEFVKKVIGFCVNKNYKMVSLDAFSLFTSVPLDKILCINLEKSLLDKSHR